MTAHSSRSPFTSVSRRHMLLGGATLSALGVLSACANGTASRATSSASAQSSAPATMTIGLTYTPNVQFAPFYLALQHNTYGASIELRHHGASEGLFDALTQGHEQVVIAGADEAAVAASNGAELTVIGGYYQSYPGCIIVPEDSPITTLADLAGHSVGLPGGVGESSFTLRLALEEAGLTQDEVDVQEIGYTQQAALMGSKVDAIVGFSNNDAVALRHEGMAVRVLKPAQIPLVGASLITTPALAQSAPTELEAIVNASAQGMESYVAKPEDAVDATKAYVADLADPEQAARALDVAKATAPLIQPEAATIIGSLSREKVSDMLTFLGSHGFLGETPVDPAVFCQPLLTA